MTYTPISTLDLNDKSYGMYSTRAEQPRCPSCRGEGTFATKGIKATRLRKFGGGNGEIPKYFGPKIDIDKDLKGLVTNYVKAYNDTATELRAKLYEFKEGLEKAIEFITTSDNYQAFCDDINAKEGLIQDMEQTIREIQTDIYKIKLERDKFVQDSTEDGLVAKDGQELKKAMEASGYVANKFPRKFFREYNKGAKDYSRELHNCCNDRDIAEHCNFTKAYKTSLTLAYERYGMGDQGWHLQPADFGEGLYELHNAYKKVVSRYDLLNTGTIMPKTVVEDIVKMDDMSLDLRIKALLAEQEKREAPKRGATKEE